MWNFKLLFEWEIDVNLLEYAVYPFGTSNDLAWAFGWGEFASRWMLTDLNFVVESLV